MPRGCMARAPRRETRNGKETLMAIIRKFVKHLPSLLVGVLNGCVISGLFLFEPELLGTRISGSTVASFYLAGALLWWGLAPAATACMGSGQFFLCCAGMLPMEVLFSLAVFRLHWLVGVLLAAVWLAGMLWFCHRYTRQLQRKKHLYNDFGFLEAQERGRDVCRRFGVLLTVVLLAVPAAWGAWTNRVHESEMPAVQPLTTEAAGKDYATDFLSGFAEDAWADTDLSGRTALAGQLAAYEFAVLGMPSDGMKISVQELAGSQLGYYSAASQRLVLDRTGLETESVWETIDTITHEAFHAQQAYVVANIDWDAAYTSAAYYDMARDWLQNYQDGYIQVEESVEGYYYQPLEVDARAYARYETDRLKNLIDPDAQQAEDQQDEQSDQ